MTIETRERLIGKIPAAKAVDFYSREKYVTVNTPQTLLVHAADDDVVSVKNSLTFFDALLMYNVKASMHIVQTGGGGHGFTLDNPPSKDKWFDWCSHWLEQNGFLTVVSK
jgi:dipeptidyl aminopeptidase/acylaminoacyl peptidase